VKNQSKATGSGGASLRLPQTSKNLFVTKQSYQPIATHKRF